MSHIDNPTPSGAGSFQPLDADLTAIAALPGTGLLARIAADTWALRTMVPPVAGMTIVNPGGVGGSPTFLLQHDLLALENVVGTGFAARVDVDDWLLRTLVAPAAGLTIANPGGVLGDPTFALANDLAALEGLATTGIAVRTALDAWATRTLVAPAAGITIANPAGLAGDPVFSLANDLAALEALAITGFAARTAADAWALRTLTGSSTVNITNGAGVAGDPVFSVLAGGIDHGALGGLGDDDHLGYLRLVGRAGGQTQNGGTTAADNMTINANSAAFAPANTGRILLGERAQLLPFSFSLGANILNALELPSSAVYTHDNAGSLLRGYQFAGEMRYTATPAFGLPGAFFNFASTIRAITSPLTMAPVPVFGSGPAYLADGVLFTMSDALGGFVDGPTFSIVNAGTFTGIYNGITSLMTLNAGAALTARRVLNILDATGAGTLTTQIAIRIADLTKGGLNLSLVSVGAGVQMRHAGQAVFGANAAPTNASVGLEVQSTTRALLLSRMTTAQRDAMTPVNGMVILNTTAGAVQARVAGAWVGL